MLNWVKWTKWISLSLMVAALVFSSAVFTAITYVKITEADSPSSAADLKSSQDPVHEERKPETTVGQAVHFQEKQFPSTRQTKPNSVLLDVTLISQLPELPRGCELTSLTMLLHYTGQTMDKMELLPEMKRDTTPIRYKDGKIDFWGHPNDGFVGDITLNSPGFGIYHEALFELLARYMPAAVDLTGESFEKLEQQLALGIPSVVWTTTDYREPSSWVSWNTPSGPFRTTYSEHAVVLTGYDLDSVYVNDPLSGKKNVKINKQQFINSWEAMGMQALSYDPKAG